MNAQLIKKLLLLFFFGNLMVMAGCGNPLELRRYEEISIDAPKFQQMADNDPHAFMKKMPQDDIHKNLMAGDQGLQGRLNQSVASVPLSWETPEGWLEKKETGGMRVATFFNKDKAFPIETTIVSLAGMAGGVSANVERWLQQLQLPVPSARELEDFIGQQEKIITASGLDTIMIDFTKRQKGASSQSPSMVAAMIETRESQIFVKMTGTKEAVSRNIDSFRALVKSIRIAGPQK